MEYHTKPFKSVITDEVETNLPQPDVPGNTTAPTVDFRNDSNVDVAVRVMVEHSWFGSSGAQIPAIQDQGGGKLVPAAVMTLTDQDTKWTNIADVLKTEGTEDEKKTSIAYHYYKTAVKPGGEIKKVFDQIKYDEEIIIDTNCTDEVTTKNQDGKEYTVTTTTCQNTDSTYADARHKVKYTIESTPYDTYKGAWPEADTITITNS